MEFLMDPTIWAGLLTLVVLEIVLGIDNLVFIAILADKLPPKQRDKARIIGLSLALIMRLGLLSVISWMAGLLYLPRLYVYHAENGVSSPQPKIWIRHLTIPHCPQRCATQTTSDQRAQLGFLAKCRAQD